MKSAATKRTNATTQTKMLSISQATNRVPSPAIW